MVTAAHCEKETNYLFNLAKLELQAKHIRTPNQSSGLELKEKRTKLSIMYQPISGNWNILPNSYKIH
jgi:hypothetical protein